MICTPCGRSFDTRAAYLLHCTTDVHKLCAKSWDLKHPPQPIGCTPCLMGFEGTEAYQAHLATEAHEAAMGRALPKRTEGAPPLEAKKSDGYKVRLELITPSFLAALGRVLTFGACKYEAHNWARGFDWSRLLGALERHVEAFKGGEDWDPETGEHHLAHAACEVMFLLEHATRGLGRDDRLKLPAELPVPADVLERRAAALAKVRKP